MRLFIAVNFSHATRARLLALRDELRSRSKRGNFSVPENLHLTLVFLGECGAGQLAAVKTAMDNTDFEPLTVNIERVGRFKRGGGDIWWAGIGNNKPLAELQRGLTRGLTDAGFAPDTRGYNPHITLGREIVTDAAPWAVEPFGETVSSVELMKSERIDGRLTYTAIYKRKAGGA